MGKKKFTSHISENLFYMYTQKTLLYFNKKIKQTNKQKMLMKKDLDKDFTKEKTWMANNHMKKVQSH